MTLREYCDVLCIEPLTLSPHRMDLDMNPLPPIPRTMFVYETPFMLKASEQAGIMLPAEMMCLN